MLMFLSARAWHSFPSVPGLSSWRTVNSLAIGMVGTSLTCTSGRAGKFLRDAALSRILLSRCTSIKTISETTNRNSGRSQERRTPVNKPDPALARCSSPDRHGDLYLRGELCSNDAAEG